MSLHFTTRSRLDSLEAGLEGLAEDETRLRRGSLSCVDDEHDSIDHGKDTLDFTSKVGVTRGINDAGQGERKVSSILLLEAALTLLDSLDKVSVVVDRRALRENRNSSLPLKIVVVHGARHKALVGSGVNGGTASEEVGVGELADCSTLTKELVCGREIAVSSACSMRRTREIGEVGEAQPESGRAKY